MKKIVTLLCSALLLAACSKDTNTPETSGFSTTQKSLVISVYPGYSDLMNTLYGDEYSISSGSGYSDHLDTFTVHTINLGSKGDGGIAGYFVKTNSTGQVAYLAPQSSTSSADIYTEDGSGGYIKNSYTITDPNYPIYGFDPDAPFVTFEPEPKGRFWGWGDYDHRGPCEEISGSSPKACSQRVYRVYYVLGIGVDTEDAYQIGTQTPLREPCDC